MPDIRAIRVLCPVCDLSLSVLIDGGDERSMRIPDGAIAAGIREHVDSAHREMRPAEPEPDVPQTTVVIHVHGGVLTERQLGEAIEKHVLRAGMRNPSAYSKYTRR